VVARLTQLPRPFIVAVITGRTSTAIAAAMQRAAYAGAHACELNLPLVDVDQWAMMSSLVASSPRPVYTSCRRAAFMDVYGRGPVSHWDEGERMARQLELLDRGSVALDIELDAFDDAQPVGVTDHPAAITEQMRTVATAHELGKEVVFSCHATQPLSRDEVIDSARIAQERGGDLAKIVAPATDEEQALDYLAAATAINRNKMLPTTVIAAGKAGRFTRLLAPVLGRSWALCQEHIEDGGFPDQPPIADAREALRILSALHEYAPN